MRPTTKQKQLQKQDKYATQNIVPIAKPLTQAAVHVSNLSKKSAKQQPVIDTKHP